MLANHRLVLALVPARGGSKGVNKKNLALVGGRPLVWHTLRAAQATPAIDEIWLSSDDQDILRVGREVGVQVFLRPADLASDEASAADVVWHYLNTLPDEIVARDPIIVYLQPTSPLRTAQHIGEALELMQRSDANSVMSVVEQRHSPFKSFKLDTRGRLQSLFDEALSNARRQDLPATYLPNGAIYAFLASEFKARGGFPSNGGVPYMMSDADSLDVDTPEDLERVQIVMGATHA